MKRTGLTIAALVTMACAFAVASPRQNYMEIAASALTGGSATANINGHVEAVYVSVSDGVSTGTVTISYAPLLGSTAVNVATNSVTDEKVWRPVVDVTDVAGVDLTSDEPARFAMAGELFTFAVTNSATGVVWKCQIITDE